MRMDDLVLEIEIDPGFMNRYRYRFMDLAQNR